MSRSLVSRIAALGKRMPRRSTFSDEQRRAWLVANGYGPDWLLLGEPRTGFVLLPPVDELGVDAPEEATCAAH